MVTSLKKTLDAAGVFSYRKRKGTYSGPSPGTYSRENGSRKPQKDFGYR